jgi:hypothetical protein
VYAYDLFTVHEFRGSNVAVVLSAFMQQSFQQDGRRRAIAVVMPENRKGYRAGGRQDIARLAPYAPS